METCKVAKTYKDRLFCLDFRKKNDLLDLYEHQSTYNPNMPVRGLALTEYDEQSHIASEKADSWAEGREVGKIEGLATGKAVGREVRCHNDRQR